MTNQEIELFYDKYIPTMRDDNKLNTIDTFSTMLQGLDILTSIENKNDDEYSLLETILEELKIEFDYIVETYVTEAMDIDDFFTFEFGVLYEKYNHLFC